MEKFRYIGISNVNLEQLKEVNEEVKIDFFEGVYNLECKIYEDNKVLEYCKANGIQFICYQPLRRNRTAIRNAISIGGNTDTIACIVGGMAEALYGVPQYLIEIAKTKLPNIFNELLENGYNILK